MATVLVVDDDRDMRWLLAKVFGDEGFEVAVTEDGQSALDRVGVEAPEAVILDLRMPGLDGMETLRKLKVLAPQVPVIMLTAYGDIPTAVQAMRLGAYDYLTKPFQNEDLVLTVRRALEWKVLRVEVEELRSRLRAERPLRALMGPSREVQRVIQQVEQVAGSTFTVLIQGETGTGKELVARAIHQESARREGPFIPLDCGAIPETLIESELFGYEKGAFTGADRRKEGHFQLADGGSLFLDEIANLPLTTQAKLLRALQERQVRPLGGTHAVPVNARIIASSNLPLETEMRVGRVRQDLYYRLAEFTITLPPLRGRQEDILPLAKRFLEEASMELKRPVRGVSEEAAALLRRYAWPGNVRELRNAIRQAVLISPDLIRPEHLTDLGAGDLGAPSAEAPGPGSAGFSLRETAAEAERRAILRALRAARGNKSRAARILETDFKTLHRKMQRFGISAREFLPG